jgi:hypothetical protein
VGKVIKTEGWEFLALVGARGLEAAAGLGLGRGFCNGLHGLHGWDRRAAAAPGKG